MKKTNKTNWYATKKRNTASTVDKNIQVLMQDAQKRKKYSKT